MMWAVAAVLVLCAFLWAGVRKATEGRCRWGWPS